MANPIITKGASIGNISAEADDEFLFQCFQDHAALSEVRNPNSSKMIILGSTGSGKTALLRMLERQEERVERLQLTEMSLSYISNSDVISFLIALDVPLERFFQALWKHVICLEFIKLRYGIDSEVKSKSLFLRLKDKFSRDQRKAKALRYLNKWEDRFWIGFDENVREVTQSLEKNIEASFAADLSKFRGDAGYRRKMSEEKKSHLSQRLQKFVDADLLSDLASVIGALSDFEDTDNFTNFVLIDDLDENWIGEDLRPRMVRSLIEALKGLRRIRSLKVVVALRSDILERVVHETRSFGFQGEKYEDYIFRLGWSADDLKRLVNSRINFFFRRKYNSENLYFEDIFIDRIGKEKSFNYIIDRTLLRPRDVISYVNECLSKAEGKPEVRRSMITSAESIFSQTRKAALVDEWRPIFPALLPCLNLLEGRRAYFDMREMASSKIIDDFLYEIYQDERFVEDPLYVSIERSTTSQNDNLVIDFLIGIMERLHLVGAVGLKTSSDQPYHWFYQTQRKMVGTAIGFETKVRVHPMLHSSLGIVT